jgi:O-antigen ligase
MGAAVMVMTTQLWITRRIWGVHAVFGFALGIPLFAVFLDTAGSLLHALGRNTTLTGRLNIWKAVLSLQTNPLFGTGFESFWLGGRLQSVSKLTGMGISEAHNGYLEVYLNLGWIGLILLMGAIAMGYRRSSALFRLNPRAGRLRLGLLAAGVIYSLTEAGFRMLSPTWIGLLFAIIVVPASLQFPEKQQAAELVTNIPRQRPVRILQ